MRAQQIKNFELKDMKSVSLNITTHLANGGVHTEAVEDLAGALTFGFLKDGNMVMIGSSLNTDVMKFVRDLPVIAASLLKSIGEEVCTDPNCKGKH